MLLELLVGFVVTLLVVAGILVMLGPSTTRVLRRIRAMRRPASVPSVFQAAKPREVVSPGLNPKTQRVLVAAARLTNWLRAHGHDEHSRELRSAARRITGNEAAGLDALQSVLRTVSCTPPDDRSSQEALKALTTQLRIAVHA